MHLLALLRLAHLGDLEIQLVLELPGHQQRRVRLAHQLDPVLLERPGRLELPVYQQDLEYLLQQKLRLVYPGGLAHLQVPFLELLEFLAGLVRHLFLVHLERQLAPEHLREQILARLEALERLLRRVHPEHQQRLESQQRLGHPQAQRLAHLELPERLEHLEHLVYQLHLAYLEHLEGL